MILVISPSKTLDFSAAPSLLPYSQPELLNESEVLVKKLASIKEEKLGALMSISDKLASLNYERFQQFSPPFTPENAKQALLAFKGDVYLGFELDKFEPEDFEFAQQHLRILSGLYGLLKPMDLIQPYRLEMGTQLKNRRGKDLYAFWGDRITRVLNEALKESQSPILINLASNEYFKSIRPKTLKARIITPVFKEERNGQLKTIALFAKKARGMMCNYVIRHRITDPQDLKHFRDEGYHFDESVSEGDTWVFRRNKD